MCVGDCSVLFSCACFCTVGPASAGGEHRIAEEEKRRIKNRSIGLDVWHPLETIGWIANLKKAGHYGGNHIFDIVAGLQ